MLLLNFDTIGEAIKLLTFLIIEFILNVLLERKESKILCLYIYFFVLQKLMLGIDNAVQ